MGYLIRVNGKVKPAEIFTSEQEAQNERDWWKSHLEGIGFTLDSFSVERFNANNPEHHSKPCPFAE